MDAPFIIAFCGLMVLSGAAAESSAFSAITNRLLCNEQDQGTAEERRRGDDQK